ncbi:MAG: ABC transporter ATP-binding protein [Bacteroidota bacterium]
MRSAILEHITIGYDADRPVLQHISFSVQQGVFLSLLGPNGSGKNPLLRLIDLVFLPQRSDISLFEQNIKNLKRSEIAKRVGFVPRANAALFPFTAFEVILLGAFPHLRGIGFEGNRGKEIALEMMEFTDITVQINPPITSISGGEWQRAFISRALAQQPGLLLLDEPNAQLDLSHQIDIFTILRRYSKQRRGNVASVSHHLNLVATFSDRVALLSNGKVFALSTPPETLIESNIFNAFRTKVLVDANPVTHAPRITPLPTDHSSRHRTLSSEVVTHSRG